MKNIFKIITAAGALAAICLSASAQQPVTPKIYGLTNTTSFTVAGAGTNVASAGTTTINSQPFPIWRGRGFVLHTSTICADAGTSNNVYTFQTTTPVLNAGVLTTNWSTAGTFTATQANNGATRVYGYVLIPPTTVDNEQLCRLQKIVTTQTNVVSIDPTNTYVSVIP
jgi:hypothetical protein